jgi:hypothetical protein
MTTFTQLTNSVKAYSLEHLHLDGTDLPVTSKPVWTVTHAGLDGATTCGTLETSVDAHTGRFRAGASPGSVKITVVASASPSAVVMTEFAIEVRAHPQIAASSKFTVTQGPDRPLH